MGSNNGADGRPSDAVIAAYLHCVYKIYRHNDIANIMGVSAAEVSVLLKEARGGATPWYVEHKEFQESALTPAHREYLHRYWPKELNQVRSRLAYGQQPHWTLSIINSTPNHQPSSKDYTVDERLRHFRLGAADWILDLLPQMSIVGVSWGKTIYHVLTRVCDISSMASRKMFREKLANQLAFVPICGQPLNYPMVHMSSSSIVAALHKCFTGRDDALSLGAAAAFIPKQFSDRGTEYVLREFFDMIDGYRKVFRGHGDEAPMIDRLDTLIMSVGSAAPEVENPILEGAREVVGIDRNKISEICLGDVAGWFVPKDSRSEIDKTLIAQINAQWTGIKQAHIERCARRASENGTPGVIIVAAGAPKADVLMYCIENRLVNRVIVDQELAAELEKRMSVR